MQIDIENTEDELFEYKTILADKGQQPLRVDKFLMDRLPQMSRSKIQRVAKGGGLTVNGEIVKSNHKIKAEDLIVVSLPHEKEEIEIIPEYIPLDIVYEDEDVLVINKAAGMVVHPGYGNHTGTLVNALAYHFKNLPVRDEVDRPGIVHRLDKGTTGLMVVAKSDVAMTKLAKQFYDRTSERRYWALTWGEPSPLEGRIEGNIGRSLKDRKIMSVFPDGEFGKSAITTYKTIERFGYVSLVECKLKTGRTHQIRAHFKWIGHPLFGDIEYGGNRILKGTIFNKFKQFVDNNLKLLPRQALHAKTLGFTHPTTDKWMQFDSDLPKDMEEVITRWQSYIQNRPEDF